MELNIRFEVYYRTEILMSTELQKSERYHPIPSWPAGDFDPYYNPLIMKSRSKRLLVHGLAMVSIAFGSLAPAISQAVSIGQTGSGFAIEVCTSTGKKMIEHLDEESSPTKSSESCPYCITHQPISVPLGDQLQFAAPEQLSFFPPLFYHAPKPLLAWVKQPSQAPPQFS
jgi:hypothetical protein